MNKDKKIPSVNIKQCVACRVCVFVCPFGCLDTTNIVGKGEAKAYPELQDVDKCTGCMICMNQCPVEAIEMIER